MGLLATVRMTECRIFIVILSVNDTQHINIHPNWLNCDTQQKCVFCIFIVLLGVHDTQNSDLKYAECPIFIIMLRVVLASSMRPLLRHICKLDFKVCGCLGLIFPWDDEANGLPLSLSTPGVDLIKLFSRKFTYSIL